MEKNHNHSKFKYLLILCISISLLLSQADRLHMHLEHDDHSMSSGHIVGVHPESTVHDFGLTSHHGEHQDNHSAVAIDVSADKLPKKTNSLDPLSLILLFIVFFLTIPRLKRVTRQKLCKISFISCCYLLQPPLRAPPPSP
jgi:hypothetical protein